MSTDTLPLLLGVGLAVVPTTWRWLSHLVTLVHEAGHAVAALATGRKLDGIRLHRDTSGLTTSVGRPRGPGMVLTASAGYLAPTMLGAAVLLLVRQGHTAWAAYLALAVVGFVLAFIRNWYGVLVVLAAGAATAALIWRASPQAQELAISAIAWLLLAGAVRASLDLWSHRRRTRSRTSDADVLARLTHVPAVVWNVLFIATCTATLVWAARPLVVG
ncbi:M50 family metallopeptidase [Aeromicrobium sp. CTD01-1L150]|uniref:M50 family metallopeptidase n=1 Tax=Aeromicrobium sp. CTD01-1L150 TaxID=3341830 RepID=UPI0035C08984